MFGQTKFKYSLDGGSNWITMPARVTTLGSVIIINNSILKTSVKMKKFLDLSYESVGCTKPSINNVNPIYYLLF